MKEKQKSTPEVEEEVKRFFSRLREKGFDSERLAREYLSGSEDYQKMLRFLLYKAGYREYEHTVRLKDQKGRKRFDSVVREIYKRIEE